MKSETILINTYSRRNTESMFAFGMMNSLSCEHNKDNLCSTGPCDNCKVKSVYGTSPKGDSLLTSSSYGTPPGCGFAMGNYNDVKKEIHRRQVKWSENEAEFIPDLSKDEFSDMKKTLKTSPKPILKHRETCVVVVYGGD